MTLVETVVQLEQVYDRATGRPGASKAFSGRGIPRMQEIVSALHKLPSLGALGPLAPARQSTNPAGLPDSLLARDRCRDQKVAALRAELEGASAKDKFRISSQIRDLLKP